MNIKNLKWYNTLQFIMLCITLPIVALDWQLGLWSTMAFGVATVVKIIAEKKVGNPSLDTALRITLCTVAVLAVLCSQYAIQPECGQSTDCGVAQGRTVHFPSVHPAFRYFVPKA